MRKVKSSKKSIDNYQVRMKDILDSKVRYKASPITKILSNERKNRSVLASKNIWCHSSSAPKIKVNDKNARNSSSQDLKNNDTFKFGWPGSYRDDNPDLESSKIGTFEEIVDAEK